MKHTARELGFWLAVGLAALGVSALLKIAASKVPGMPDGLARLIHAA